MRKLESKELLNLCVTGMRLSLGIIFLWFGLIKFSEYNPVFEIINASFPFLAVRPGLYFLAGLESLIGLGLFLNIFPRIVHITLILHLLGTFSTFILSPEIMFYPHFPFLNLAGEFVVKNLALAMGGLLILHHEQHKNEKV